MSTEKIVLFLHQGRLTIRFCAAARFFVFYFVYSKLPLPSQGRPKNVTQNLTELLSLNPFFGHFFFSWIFQYILSPGGVSSK